MTKREQRIAEIRGKLGEDLFYKKFSENDLFNSGVYAYCAGRFPTASISDIFDAVRGLQNIILSVS